MRLGHNLHGLAVNDQVGTTYAKLSETASQNGEPSADRKGSIPLLKFPPQFFLRDLTVCPLTVNYDGTVDLMWSGSASASYVLQYSTDQGEQNPPVKNVGPYTSLPLTDPSTIFTLTVTVTG